MKTSTFLIIVFIIVGFFTHFIYLTYMHEATHQEIYKMYHIDSEIHLFSKKFPFLEAYVKPEEDCPNDFCRLGHNMNEIVSYNLDGFYWTIFSGLLIIMMILREKKE